jgi:hypothetical protein
MKKIQILILGILLTLIYSCSSIRSIHKLGEESLKINKEEWEGTWISGDASFYVKVIDTTISQIEIMSIENGKLEKHSVFINQNGNNTYGNLLTKDKHYIFVKFKKRKNELLMWLPELEMIKVAINSNKLEGIIKDKDILIKSEKKLFNKYFIDNKEKMLFEYEKPFIFKKLLK